MNHKPVLLKEVLKHWKNQNHGVFLDATFGRGGHSQALLNEISADSQLWAFDCDYEAVLVGQRLADRDPRFRIIQTNFKELNKIRHQYQIPQLDGILFDLGVSSPQLDNPQRGFSYHYDGPLDMRMDQEQTRSALEVINEDSVHDLTNIFKWYGETQYAKLVAQKIAFVRTNRPITTTIQLVEIIKSALPKKVLIEHKHPARVFFQALRIHVNNELSNIYDALNLLPMAMKTKGVVVLLTFHSLEEKIIKAWVKKNCGEINLGLVPERVINQFTLVTKHPITPSISEINENPRARSAKMWVMVKN